MAEALVTYISANHHYPFDELLELLRQQGFTFGIDTYQTAHYVIMKVIEAGELEQLDRWLCPVLAHSAEQQAAFLEIYKRLFIPFVQQQQELPEKKELPEKPNLHTAEQQDNPDTPTVQEEEPMITVASLKARSSASYAFDRFVASTTILIDHTLIKVVRQLRYTAHSGRYSFDIDKTIQKTIHSGGMARPVYTPLHRHVEYLMLIDRQNLRDHQAQLHNNLYETLKANNIFVERFFFDNSPLVCRNHHHPGGIALTEILSLYEHAGLMLFTNGLQFIDTYYLKTYAWADIFKHWQHRYFFSSVSPALWGERERLFQGVFPFVLPLSVEGMQVVAGDLSQTAHTDFDWLHYWQQSADYALVPVETEHKKLEYIGLFFSKPVKRWIAVCAVYPELNWNLTLALGKELGEWYPGEQSQLHSYRNISQLLRLDWFKKGDIPDAFRVALMTEWLADKEIAAVCHFLYRQLSQNQPLPDEPDYDNRRLQLDIYDLLGETDEEKFHQKARQLTEALARQQHRPDMVSLHVINERDNCRAFFEIPDSVLLRWGIDPSQTRRAKKDPRNFVRIPAGEFTMGSPEGEPGRAEIMELFQNNNLDYSETQHQVKVSEFYLSKYAVTLAEFKQFIDESGYQTDAEKENSSRIWDGKEWKDKEGVNWRHGVSGNERASEEENHPVLHVSWNDAVAYCKWMSNKTGKSFRLPTEAEWEYACRAGTTTPFNTGENLTTDQANYDGNYPYNNNQKGKYRENTVPVDSFEPNAWGLYNMHGNVWEWCRDWYEGKYYEECKAKGTVTNPSGPETGSYRVVRGGSWYNFAEYCRSAHRYRLTPDARHSFGGFRLVFVP
ncbi:MAG: formylglycine-generating enzyme family protein [Chlorobium sp.]